MYSLKQNSFAWMQHDPEGKEMSLLAGEGGTASPRNRKAIFRLRTPQPRIQIGSEVFLYEIQEDLDFRGQPRAVGVQGARHDRFWLPSWQDAHKPLGDGRVESDIQGQNGYPHTIQHELSMH